MICLTFFLIFITITNAFPEPGHYEYKSLNFTTIAKKSMFKNTYIDINVICRGSKNVSLTLGYRISKLNCSKSKVVGNNREVKRQIICGKTFTDNKVILPKDNSSIYYYSTSDKHFLVTNVDGIFDITFDFSGSDSTGDEITVKMDMKNQYGYLSAKDWPLLVFYGAMLAVYSILAILWFVLSCRNWKDLLRIQLWIGAVIVLGAVEKAMFVAEYEYVRGKGTTPEYPMMVAETVSCIKRALARILLMIVCGGYGIVKQRLGPAMRKILGVGLAYFLAALVEAYLRVRRPDLLENRWALATDFVLVVLDGLIVWWSFSYLIETIKQMRLKRNLVKFNLYRHFSNILIIVVVASVVFMLWALYTFRASSCMRHWKELWVNEAFWHVLFSIVLLTIVILWRPSKNSQRYAYSPLLDVGDDMDDDDDNVIMDNITSGELRKPNKENQPKKPERKTAEDDLKWIEENIPVSAAEKMYPLVDSDGEIAPSKLTTGKMD